MAGFILIDMRECSGKLSHISDDNQDIVIFDSLENAIQEMSDPHPLVNAFPSYFIDIDEQTIELI